MKLSEQALARELYAQGISRQVIATRLGASRSAVTKWTADMPVPEKPCPVCNKHSAPNGQTSDTVVPSVADTRIMKYGKRSIHHRLQNDHVRCVASRFQPRNDPRQVYCSTKCRDQVRNRQNYLARKAASPKE